MHLRDDRCRGDGTVDRVAVDQSRLRQIDSRDDARVDEQVIRRHAEPLDRPAHRAQSGAQHVEPIHLARRDRRHRERQRLGADLPGEALARGPRQALRVVEARKLDSLGQHDGGGHHGSGERPHPDLVDSGHPADPGREQPPAVRE